MRKFLLQMIKNFIKKIVPPILLDITRFIFNTVNGQSKTEVWSGDYSTWTEAQAKCTGYNTEIILEKCKIALLKVKNGEAVYERDSVIFNEIHYSFGLLAGLQKAALENDGKLCVLDFGGSLGSSYYQNKGFLSSLKELQWCIVEQAHFVECGKEYFEDDQLKFFSTIEECLAIHQPNVLLLSSVLQYLENPYEWIEKFVNLNIPFIIIDRTALIDNEKDILTVQNVPLSIYSASYPAWFFNFDHIIKAFTFNYELIIDFDDAITEKTLLIGKTCWWKGLILKRKNGIS